LAFLRYACLLLALLLPASAADWTCYRSATLETCAQGDARDARTLLAWMEQSRFLFAALSGVTDPQTEWPLRVLLTKQQPPTPGFLFARRHRIAITASPESFSASQKRALAEAFFAHAPGRAGADLESSLIALIAGMEHKFNRLTLSHAPRTPHDRLVAMMMSTITGQSRLRMVVAGLLRGTPSDVAWRNATTKTEAEMLQEAAAYSGPATTIVGRPLAPDKDFLAIPQDDNEAKGILLDAALSEEPLRTGACSSATTPLEKLECDAIVLLHNGDREGSAKKFIDAQMQGSQLPQALVTAGIARSNIGMLDTAARLYPRWSRPLEARADLEGETDAVRAQLLTLATKRQARDSALWVKLARRQTEAGDYAAAAHAWARAEQVSSTPEAARAMSEQRARFEEERVNLIEAEKQRRAAEEQADLDRVRQASERRIREAEARANADAPDRPGRVYETYELDGSAFTEKATLESVECSGNSAVLLLRDAKKKPLRYTAANANRVSVKGNPEYRRLPCGPLLRPLAVELLLETKTKNVKALTFLP
jgi:hypothetical protein